MDEKLNCRIWVTNAQKNTLLQVAQANAETKTCKRVFFSPTQEKLKNKKSPMLQNNKTSFHRTMLNLTDIASIVNRFGQSVCGLDTIPLRTDRRASGNKGFNEMAADVVNQTVVLLSNSIGLTNICASKPPLHKPPNRYL